MDLPEISFIKNTRSSKKKTVEPLPTHVMEHHKLINHSYTIAQLKTIAKSFSLKVSGTKLEITKTIYEYMYFYPYAMKIQGIFRKMLARKYRQLIRFRNTVNDDDFLTMEKMVDIPKPQFFSFKDKDGFVYGFDAMSFYHLVFVNKIITNPYNRSEIQPEIIDNFNFLIRITSCLQLPFNITIEKDEITPAQQQELKVVEIFQEINSLGNYANSVWFMDLTPIKLIKFMKELNDIWSYRSQLTESVKRNICSPFGNPFRSVRFYRINSDSCLYDVRQEIIKVLDLMIYSGIDRDNRTLGSYYVLCALTLVSETAANALPWLYQSVQYY